MEVNGGLLWEIGLIRSTYLTANPFPLADLFIKIYIKYVF